MQRKLFGRRTTAVLAATALVGTGIGVFGATGAGAAGGPTSNGPSANTQQSDCTSSSTLGGTRTLPFVTTLAGSASDTNVYPSGATVGFTGAIAVTIPGQVVAQTAAGSAASGATLTQIGIVDEGVSVAASNTVSGGFSVAGTGAQLQTPDPVNGNTFIIPVSGNVVSSGTNGGFINFSQGTLNIAFNLTVNGAINIPFSAATCVTNNQNGVLNAGEAQGANPDGTPNGVVVEFGLPYPPAPAATTALVATNPTVTNLSTTVSSAAPTSQVQMVIAPATPQAPGGTPSPISTVTIAPTGAVGAATITTGGLVTYTPPNNQFSGTEVFTVTATDASGQVGTGTLTLSVVAGDATSADVTVSVSGAVGAQLFIPACGGNTAAKSAPCPTIVLSAINLNGKKQTATGNIGQVTVVDARGLPLPWALTAKLAGPLQNQLPPSGSLPGDGNNRIESNQLTMSGQTCAVDTANNGGGLYSATTAGAAGTLNNSVTVCQAAIGQSGGTFLANASLSLNVNPDIYVGTYLGTINFLLA